MEFVWKLVLYRQIWTLITQHSTVIHASSVVDGGPNLQSVFGVLVRRFFEWELCCFFHGIINGDPLALHFFFDDFIFD